MTYIAYSVLDGHGKPERHYRMGGDRALDAIRTFERLSGRKPRSMSYHKEAGCWISEVSAYSPKNGDGDPNFLERVEVRS